MSEAQFILARGTATKEQCREVYFLFSPEAGLVKIGVANRSNVIYRLRGIAAQCPMRLKLVGVMQCDRYGATEPELHARFADERRHGEWFQLSERLLGFIKTEAWMPERMSELQRELDQSIRPRGRPRKDASGTGVEKRSPKPA